MKQVPLYRWRPKVGENLGDFLSVPILRAMGYEPVAPVTGQPCLTCIGSILHPNHYGWSGASRLVVYGSGIGNNSAPPAGVTLDFRAVRGPITQRLFRLPDDIPLGDPALLLPRFMPPIPPSRFDGHTIYINHIGTQPPNVPPGFNEGLSAHTTEDTWQMLVARIAAASFVASESLHGCIVAAAYGVPWAPMSVREEAQWCEIGAAAKWQDWLEYLGLPHLPAFPKTLDDAWRWWESVGRHGRVRDLEPLLKAFPGELAG